MDTELFVTAEMAICRGGFGLAGMRNMYSFFSCMNNNTMYYETNLQTAYKG